MRIQKKQIEEAILGISQQTPSSEEVNNTTSAINNMNDALKKAGKTADENPMPFMKKVDENNFDPNYGRDEDMEYMAWKNNEVRDAFHEWLVTTPEGQAYTRELENQSNQPEVNPTDDLPFGESVKNNRKVLKTIKVKNLK
jgi:hypothetical protein